MSISSNRIQREIRNPTKLSVFDFYFVKVVESLNSLVILSGIYDFTLYCSHEILHHDIRVKQLSTVRISLLQAYICLTLVVIEVVLIYQQIHTLNFVKIQKFHKKVESIKDYIKNEKDTIKNRKAAKERLNYYKLRFEYRYGAMLRFFIEGIKPEKLNTFIGRYLKFFMMLKLVIFEVLIVSLQMLPKAQITLLLLCQLYTMGLVFWAVFINRVYSTWAYGFVDLLIEVTITLFLIIGAITSYSDNPASAIEPKLFQRIQIWMIWLIMVVAGVSVIRVIANSISQMIGLFNRRQLKASRKENVLPFEFDESDLREIYNQPEKRHHQEKMADHFKDKSSKNKDRKRKGAKKKSRNKNMKLKNYDTKLKRKNSKKKVSILTRQFDRSKGIELGASVSPRKQIGGKDLFSSLGSQMEETFMIIRDKGQKEELGRTKNSKNKLKIKSLFSMKKKEKRMIREQGSNLKAQHLRGGMTSYGISLKDFIDQKDKKSHNLPKKEDLLKNHNSKEKRYYTKSKLTQGHFKKGSARANMRLTKVGKETYFEE